MQKLIGPLLSFTAQIKDISTSQDHHKRVKVNTRDEIGELAESFNSLMSELESREAELTESQELYQTLADWSNGWIFWKSAEGKMLYVSPAANKITGYSSEQLMEYSENFDKLIHPDDRALWQQHQQGADHAKDPLQLDVRILTKNGEVRWISHTCRAIYSDQGRYLGLRGCNTDITERKQIEEQLRHLSSRDGLTGLYNRGYFDCELSRLVPEHDFPVGILVADLDGLKQVNDEMGHAAGDRLIRQASRLLLRAFRSDDVVARIGSDEFAVLMPCSDESAVIGAVQRIRKLESEYNLSQRGMRLSISVGSAIIDANTALNTALEIADTRMYLDKKQRKQKLSQLQPHSNQKLRVVHSQCKSL